jgi:hypothetical protein
MGDDEGVPTGLDGQQHPTDVINATTLTGTAASPALVSIAAQHPSATITDLPGPAYVAKATQVQGG